MNASRLTRLSESNEDDEEEVNVETPLKDKPSRSHRNSAQLHVTINTKAEAIDSDEAINGGQSLNPNDSLQNNRRPSVLIHDILATRRPSAIMAAFRSPKQFVNKYRRE